MSLLTHLTARGRFPKSRLGAARPTDRSRCRLTLEKLEDRLLPAYYITDLGTLGGTLSNGIGVSQNGQVVGASELACYCTSHPFLWAEGTLHDLGTLGQGGSSAAMAINELGQVVGYSVGRPFLWSRESGMTDLGFFGQANDVNNRAQVVGLMSSPPHAFRWQAGALLDLGTLGGTGTSIADSINDQGEIVGQASGRAFLWTEPSGMRDLGTLDGTSGGTSAAAAINDRGQIVGDSYSIAVGNTHAAAFSKGQVTDLGTLGSYSWANALNNRGQVVGQSGTGTGPHAFLTDLDSMQMVDLNTLIPPGTGWVLTDARAINDAGQIAGSGTLPGYDMVHAYLLTPEEDPSAAVVTAAPAFAEARPLPDTGSSSSWGAAPVQAPGRVVESGEIGRAPSRGDGSAHPLVVGTSWARAAARGLAEAFADAPVQNVPSVFAVDGMP